MDMSESKKDKKPTGTDVNQVQITRLSQIRGQPQVIGLLELSLAAHFNMRGASKGMPPTFGPVILCGPPGTGKTMVARAIHAELGNLHLVETNGVALKQKCELYSVLINADEFCTIFVDEAQALNAQAQHILLTALSARLVHVPVPARSADWSGTSLRTVKFVSSLRQICVKFVSNFRKLPLSERREWNDEEPDDRHYGLL